ncbi:hypothetical protein [Duganella vulcania]|uniref:Uncharacterized protein n=1 Tax=Duganella vulcania TaxID=2692166 RepID=A0A845GEX1_9BURK|nr:hypothetical protein [Duganella vulcania]MYM92461.1 hypothetical protein [Duganella vulcania]
MSFIIKWIIRLMILTFTINVSFRAMNAMLVHDNASLYFHRDACPVKPNSDGDCVMVGSVSHTLATDDVEISTGRTVMLVPDRNVAVISYAGDSARYEPFGKVVAFLIGMSIMGLGFLLAFGSPLRGRTTSAGAR